MAGLQCSSYQRNQRSDDITGCFKGITPILWFPLNAFLDAICHRRIRTSNSPLAFTYQVNISLIVNDDEAEQCVRSLHSAFFESGVSELDRKCVSDNGSVQLRRE